jgi:two-component system sensor histidine kinase BaeS
LVRLLATAVLIAVCSIAATAWLAVQSTTRAIERAQGQALSDDAHIYDTLLGYAATHPNWDDVAGTVRGLAATSGRHITLTRADRTPIADSASGPAPLPDRESAVVDPLQVDSALHPGVPDRIDPRAVGPYLLPEGERGPVRAHGEKLLSCLENRGYTGSLRDLPSGRVVPVVDGRSPGAQAVLDSCRSLLQRTVPDMPTERRARDQLTALANDCLERRGLDKLTVVQDFTWFWAVPPGPEDRQAQECVDAGRREQLRPYVAPPALLFVRAPQGAPQSPFDLSRANLLRIVGVTGLVLTVTVALSALLAVRLVRPLRALTAAARRPAGDNVRVQVRGSDVVAVLAAAFNDLSERRERAEAQRRDMVSDVAHELRTPLTNIRSWLEATQDGLATAVSDPALTTALLGEALQLQRIVEDLQDLAAADAGRLPLLPERVRLADLLDQVHTAHEGAAEAAGVQLRTRTTGDPHLRADPVRVRQAVTNLLSNAIRYTPSGGTVTVTAREEGGRAVIVVADTGPGIAPHDLPHVFDRFWRAEKSRRRQTGGSGLGLAIVRQIATAHGGDVTATSTPGAGSTFTLRVPSAA